jgi:hypothetical protein
LNNLIAIMHCTELSLSVLDHVFPAADCNKPMDLQFIIDRSGSIGSDMPTVESFAINIAEQFIYTGSNTRFSLVSFSDSASTDQTFSQCSSSATASYNCLAPKITNLNSNGYTNTPDALNDGKDVCKYRGHSM